MSFALTLAMLRRHRAAYIGMAVVLIAASTLVSSSLALLAAADPGSVSTAGLTRNAAAKLLLLLGNGRFASTLMAVLAAFIAVFLVAQTAGFVVEGRRQDLAMLRLAGATPWQIRLLLLGESGVVGLLCSVTGAAFAAPLVPSAAMLLSAQNNWPSGVTPQLHIGALVASVLLMAVITAIGVAVPAWRISRCRPMTAVASIDSARGRQSTGRWIVGAIGVVLVLAFALAPGRAIGYQVSTAVVGGGAALIASAFVPVLVVAVARWFGSFVVMTAPAAGLLARERASRAARRAPALVTPAVVLLTLAAVFGALAQTGRAEMAAGLRSLTHVHAVVEFPDSRVRRQAAERIATLDEVRAATVVRRVEDWAWGGPRAPSDDFPELMAISPSTFRHFADVRVDAGDLAAVRGRNVAALSGSSEVGDSLRLEAPDGRTLSVRVVATILPTSFVYGTLLVDEAGLPLGQGGAEDTVLVDSARGVSDEALLAAVRRAAPALESSSREVWIGRSVARSVANQRSSIVTLIGGGTLLAMATLAQATFASVRERRDEIALLHRLGASVRTVIVSSALEALLMVMVGATLATAVTAIVVLHLRSALRHLDPMLVPVIPIGVLAWVLLVCAATSIGVAAIATAVLACRRGAS